MGITGALAAACVGFVFIIIGLLIAGCAKDKEKDFLLQRLGYVEAELRLVKGKARRARINRHDLRDPETGRFVSIKSSA